MNRPITRGDCVDGPRPCPHACRYQLPSGSCALDVADEGPQPLSVIAGHCGVSKERARQLVAVALAKVRRRLAILEGEVVS